MSVRPFFTTRRVLGFLALMCLFAFICFAAVASYFAFDDEAGPEWRAPWKIFMDVLPFVYVAYFVICGAFKLSSRSLILSSVAVHFLLLLFLIGMIGIDEEGNDGVSTWVVGISLLVVMWVGNYRTVIRRQRWE